MAESENWQTSLYPVDNYSEILFASTNYIALLKGGLHLKDKILVLKS